MALSALRMSELKIFSTKEIKVLPGFPNIYLYTSIDCKSDISGSMKN